MFNYVHFDFVLFECVELVQHHLNYHNYLEERLRFSIPGNGDEELYQFR